MPDRFMVLEVGLGAAAMAIDLVTADITLATELGIIVTVVLIIAWKLEIFRVKGKRSG